MIDYNHMEQPTGPQPFCTEEEARALSSLKNHPGFITLLRLLELDLQNTEELLSKKSDASEALKLLRYWQFQRRILETFILGPEKIFHELEYQRNLASMEADPTRPMPNYFAGQPQMPPPRDSVPGRRPVVPIR